MYLEVLNKKINIPSSNLLILELGRYRFFRSVSVFGVFRFYFKVGRFSVSVFTKTSVSVSVFATDAEARHKQWRPTSPQLT